MLIIYIYLFLGEEAGVWFIDLKNGKGATGKGEPAHPADATFTMDSQSFFAMFTGEGKFFHVSFYALLFQLFLFILQIYNILEYICL